MSLDKIFGLYTVGFLAITVLIGIGEAIGLFSNQMIGWIFMALSLLIYVFIGIVTRTSNPDQYYVAGRGVPAVYNGMATGSDWMSAASFISMGGALSAQGFAGLAYVMGWTGGYLLLAVFLGPYLRQFARIRSLTSSARASAATGADRRHHRRVVCSFTYLIAQVTASASSSRAHRLDFNIGVFVGLLGVLFCSVLGGIEVRHVRRRSRVHHPHRVPRAHRVHVVDTVLRPGVDVGQILQRDNVRALGVTRDAKEKETRTLWKKDADEARYRDRSGPPRPRSRS